MLQLLRNRQQHGLNPATRGSTHYEIMPLSGFEPQTIDMNDATFTLLRQGVQDATQAILIGNLLLVDPASSGTSENLLLPPEAQCEGLVLWIFNTGGESIALQNDAGGALVTIETARAAIASCDGTTWRALTFVPGNILSANIEEDLIQYADVQLTNAQVLALNATPITLVAAPGANRAIVVLQIYGVADSAGGAYTETGGQDMAVEYSGGADIQTLDNTGFMTTGDVQARYWRPDASAIAGLTPVANQAVQLFKTVAEFGGGNAANTLSIRVHYMVVDTVAFT